MWTKGNTKQEFPRLLLPQNSLSTAGITWQQRADFLVEIFNKSSVNYSTNVDSRVWQLRSNPQDFAFIYLAKSSLKFLKMLSGGGNWQCEVEIIKQSDRPRPTDFFTFIYVTYMFSSLFMTWRHYNADGNTTDCFKSSIKRCPKWTLHLWHVAERGEDEKELEYLLFLTINILAKYMPATAAIIEWCVLIQGLSYKIICHFSPQRLVVCFLDQVNHATNVYDLFATQTITCKSAACHRLPNRLVHKTRVGSLHDLVSSVSAQ